MRGFVSAMYALTTARHPARGSETTTCGPLGGTGDSMTPGYFPRRAIPPSAREPSEPFSLSLVPPWTPRLLRSRSVVLAVLLGACSGTAGTAIVASSPQTIGVGTQRLLVGLLDEDGNPVGGPDIPVTVELRSDGETVAEVPAEWVWTIEGTRGFSVVNVDLDHPGQWEVVLHREGLPPTPPSPFMVVEDVPIPEVGEPAPASQSPTYPARPLAEITTDPDPDPAFYATSVAEAVSGGTVSVIVFASPAFCQTATCGPILDRIKEIAPRHPDVTFVHVEIYQDLGGAARGVLETAPAVQEWGLPSEPWVFVVGPDGRVRAHYEGTVSETEIEAVLR